jgi:hypothetical protein
VILKLFLKSYKKSHDEIARGDPLMIAYIRSSLKEAQDAPQGLLADGATLGKIESAADPFDKNFLFMGKG